MPGPAPNPNARHRQGGRPTARTSVLRLPAGGRPGAPPKWPLLTVPAAIEHLVETEQVLWAQLWAMPQAVAWEHDRVHREVAMYCRQSLLAESGERYAA